MSHPAIPLPARHIDPCPMLKRLERREAYRLTHSFVMIAHDVHTRLYHKRPASVWRLTAAATQMMHFVIHSDSAIKKRRGQWRLRRALAAARAAAVVLKRLSSEHEHRAIISATAEVLERAIRALEEEIVQ